MRKRTVVGAALTGAAVVIAVTGVVTHVAYAATTGSAYVWASSPGNPSYTADAGYSYNSTGGVNTVTHDGTGAGQYTVNLPGLGGFSGTVLVTAYGGNSNSCKVARWGPSPSNSTIQQVHVQCFTISGAAVDSQYTVSFTNQLGPKHAWLWANQASAPLDSPYQPAAAYQANSTGQSNTVTHRATGVYRVSVPVSNVGSSFGHWEITAYGTGNERCIFNQFGSSGGATTTAELADVVCLTPAGQPVDAMFATTWVLDGNVLGLPVWQGSGSGYPSMYVENGSGSHTAASDSSPGIVFAGGGGNLTVTRLSAGTYVVHSPLDPDLSHGGVQVSTGGNADGTTCNVQYWNPTDGIHVNCYGTDGKLRDAAVFVGFIGTYLIA